MAKLSDNAKKYLDKEIVGKVITKIGDYQQIAAMLAVLDIMSQPEFRNLLRYVPTFNKIGALKSYTKDKRIAKPANKLYNHLTRKKFLWVAEDFINTHNSLRVCYVYAVTEIFNRMKKRAMDDQAILNASAIKDHPKLMSAMLGAAGIDQQLVLFREYCDKKQISEERYKVIWKYFKGNEVDLKRLCVLGRNQTINVAQQIQASEKICQFFNDDKATAAFLEHVTTSIYMKKGGRLYFSPARVGWVAAIATGFFTAAILAWALSVLTPIVIAISPFILIPATAIISIAILTCLPMLVKTFASWSTAKYNGFKSDKFDDALEEKSVNYAQIVADYRDKSLKTLPESSVRKAVADAKGKYTLLKEKPDPMDGAPIFA